MSKRQIIMLIGVWVGIFLFMGVPSSWHKVIAIITGLVLIIIAYKLDGDTNAQSDQIEADKPFEDHRQTDSVARFSATEDISKNNNIDPNKQA